MAITKSTTVSLTMTMTVLEMALSRMPITRMTVTRARIRIAGRLSQAPGVEKGSLHKKSGMR